MKFIIDSKKHSAKLQINSKCILLHYFSTSCWFLLYNELLISWFFQFGFDRSEKSPVALVVEWPVPRRCDSLWKKQPWRLHSIMEIRHETGVKQCIKRNISKMTIDVHCFPQNKLGNFMTSVKSKTNSCNFAWQRDKDWVAHNQVARAQCFLSQKKATRWPALQEMNHKNCQILTLWNFDMEQSTKTCTSRASTTSNCFCAVSAISAARVKRSNLLSILFTHLGGTDYG